MRRDVAIALLVLIPVAILISLSLGEKAGGEGETNSVQQGKFAVAALETIDAGSGSAPAPQPLSPREREIPPFVSAALITNARQCLADQKNASSVEVHFTPTRGGRYADVKVTTQDPYLAACLEDVFEEAQWTVSAAATESFSPTKHTFTAQ